MKSFSLPVGDNEAPKPFQTYPVDVVATWIVAMLGNNSSCMNYLRSLFVAIKNFYHPSNCGEFQADLISFIVHLSHAMVDRVFLYVDYIDLFFC